MVFGFNIQIQNEESIIENFDSPLYSEYYSAYSIEEIPENIRPYISNNNEVIQDVSNSKVINYEEIPMPLDGPMDSAWPMFCHDVRHTSRSPYSTADNTGHEKWRYEIPSTVDGDIAIDENGNIYVGANGLYAFYPNGALKWEYITHFKVHGAPAIDEDGTIYFGTIFGDTNFYSLYPGGTLKWKLNVDSVFSSPAIGDDGSIYFGCADDFIYALYPNRTLKWKYQTNHVVYSSPAIGDDGTVYCGSHDGALYALYPNNGTLKWAFGTGNWIRTSPCIGDDGNIYVVSLDNYLYAVYPNGTMKWKTGVGAGTSPTIGQDGTIYCGYDKLFAVNPLNGSVKWTFPVDGKIRGATPCNSIDGTIYLGNFDGSDIVAVNPDGTEKWRRYIYGNVDSAPAIGQDGTVYIASPKINEGYLHAFGPLDPDAPSEPDINGPSNGKVGTEYDYTFISTSPLGRDVYYYVDWGDGGFVNWVGPYNSGDVATFSHTWSSQGTYTINARAKDTDNLWGPWGEFSITMKTRNRAAYSNTLLLRLLEQLPNAFPILRHLLGL